jgi:hypothetical protein
MPKTKIDFQTFWNAYGLKRDRIAAERAWKRLSDKDQQAAYAGIPAYCEDCQRRGIAMMYAQGYLNHRRWEDETSPKPQQVGSPSQPSPTPDSKMDIW